MSHTACVYHSVCHILYNIVHWYLLHVTKTRKTVFHAAAEENSRECMKLLVYHFKVDPDEPDVVSCSSSIHYGFIIAIVSLLRPT